MRKAGAIHRLLENLSLNLLLGLEKNYKAVWSQVCCYLCVSSPLSLSGYAAGAVDPSQFGASSLSYY